MINFFLSVVKADGTLFPAKVIRADYTDMVATVDPDPPLGCHVIRTTVERINSVIELSNTVVVEGMIVL